MAKGNKISHTTMQVWLLPRREESLPYPRICHRRGALQDSHGRRTLQVSYNLLNIFQERAVSSAW